MKRITLTESYGGAWVVAENGLTIFIGGRVAAKKFASEHCRSNGIPSWWNCKKRGVWVEIIVALAIMLATLAATAATPIEVVAAVLVAEAGGERDAARAMRAVREVIQVRAYERRQTEHAVATAPRQFSCLNRIAPARLVAIARQHPRWTEAVRLAAAPVKQATVGQSNHYHAMTVRPSWAVGQRPVAVVGSHVFYRL